ncbi:diguanylate cyclase/phosphodiesterase (GGDEF & EAL domains) with PAS/PAC sensor(s) [hydrothermal vent metagenome]|uniref:Diguanylate cyclase/phosphodiesterase (GGDEF & EAL domains) with PAS/PAC sensor(S) n=1 Tax=hydrothermal vent metagenome TaxID=652676 RepID=A0A3B1A1W3_9ZZZZ
MLIKILIETDMSSKNLEIKITESLLMEDRVDTIAISASIIALAHTLNKKVIAEGIETIEQLSMLRTKKCDIGQGYYFNKPLTAEEFKSYLAEKSTFLKILN